MAIHSSQSYYIYKSNFLRYYKLLMECRNCERLITALTINFFLRKILLHRFVKDEHSDFSVNMLLNNLTETVVHTTFGSPSPSLGIAGRGTPS